MNKQDKNNHMDCFGNLSRVFPIGPSGLREVPANCFKCPKKFDCMREALNSPEGIKFREERLSLNRNGGFMGWLRRWSFMKELSRLKKINSKKNR